MLSLFKLITKKYYLIPNLGNLYEDKMTVFKYTLTSLLAISTSFFVIISTMSKIPCNSTQNFPKLSLGRCTAPPWMPNAQLTAGEEGRPQQQMALSYQNLLPDLGWLKGWNVHQLNLAVLGAL